MPELEIEATKVHDSRGQPTVRVEIASGGVRGSATAPAGASTGQDEARTVDVDEALRNIHEHIAPLLRASELNLREPSGLERLERLLMREAGTDFARFGANAVLPVSIALWRVAAALWGAELFAYLRRCEPELAGKRAPRLMMNLYNGGLHARRAQEQLGRDRVEVQEIMVVPVAASSCREALEIGERIDQQLEQLLTQTFGAQAVSRGDEAGLSVAGLGDSEAAIERVLEAITRADYQPGHQVRLALDLAASSLWDEDTKRYAFAGEQRDRDAMIAALLAWVERYPQVFWSIEDGLEQNDWQGWTELSAALETHGVRSVGDDLFVTQLDRLRRGAEARAAHATLIKPNQNGTLRGTLDAMKYARDHGLECIVSHRSGETLDDTIADLAAATGAVALKAGAPQPPAAFPDEDRWVRRRKYLRLIEIEEMSG